MAIWQFEFNIIRERKNTRDMLSANNYDEVISWRGNSLNESSLEKLTIILPKEKSWCDEIVQYGKIDKTNLQFFYEAGEILEISCGMDLRNLEKKEFDEIVNFINDNNAMIFCDGSICNISNNVLMELITKSKAYSFSKDPVNFFYNLD